MVVTLLKMACHVFNCRKCFVQHTFVWLFYCLARRLLAPSSCGHNPSIVLSFALELRSVRHHEPGHHWPHILETDPVPCLTLKSFFLVSLLGDWELPKPGAILNSGAWRSLYLSWRSAEQFPGLCLRKKLGITIFPLLCKISVYGYWAKCPSRVGRKRGHLGVKWRSRVTWQPVVTSHLNILWCAMLAPCFIILILANKEHLSDM